nr:DUF6766 family protein [Stenotrophomonas pavanii]
MWKRNGLSLVLLALTAVFIIGQAIAGHHVHNQELVEHGRAPLDLWHYLATGHFVSATYAPDPAGPRHIRPCARLKRRRPTTPVRTSTPAAAPAPADAAPG